MAIYAAAWPHVGCHSRSTAPSLHAEVGSLRTHTAATPSTYTITTYVQRNVHPAPYKLHAQAEPRITIYKADHSDPPIGVSCTASQHHEPSISQAVMWM